MISIITINFNDKEGLLKTIKSVIDFKRNNTFTDIEYIVVDGDSTDGSKEILNEYINEIDICISEKDNGIYDAMNKGIDRANGNYILFLNSGDFFVNLKLAQDLNKPCYLPVKFEKNGILIQFKLHNIRLSLPYCHQGIVFPNTDIHYDDSFKICADYKYFLDVFGTKRNLQFIKCEGYVYYDSAGVSSKKIKKRDEELFSIRKLYFSPAVCYLFEFYSFIKRFIRRYIRGEQL